MPKKGMSVFALYVAFAGREDVPAFFYHNHTIVSSDNGKHLCNPLEKTT